MRCDLEATQMRREKDDSLPARVRLGNLMLALDVTHELHECVLRFLPEPHHLKQHLAALGRCRARLGGCAESCGTQVLQQPRLLALDKRERHYCQRGADKLDNSKRKDSDEPK